MPSTISRWINPALLLALATAAVPASADDPFIETKARYTEALAALDENAADTAEGRRADAVSEAIAAGFFGGKQDAAQALFLANEHLDLQHFARVLGMGLTLREETDDAKAAERLALLMSYATAEPEPGSMASAFAMALVAEYWWRRDDLPATVAAYAEAKALAGRDLPADHPAHVYFASQYSRYLRYQDRVAGTEAARETERLATSLLPDGHPLWIAIITDQAENAMTLGRYDEAQALLARVSDIALAEWGDGDPRLFSILQFRTIALSGLARYPEAETMARLAIDFEQGQPSVDRAMHRELLGSVIYGQGRVDEAIGRYREGLALLAGTDHGDLRWAHLRSRLARALSVSGKHSEAIELIALARPEFKAKLPETHPMRLFAEQLDATVLARGGQAEQAYEALRETVDVNEARLLDIYARSQDTRTIAAGNNTLFQDFTWIALQADRPEEAWRAAQLTTLGELAQSSAYLGYPGDPAGFKVAVEAVRVARDGERKARQALADGEDTSAALALAVNQREAADAALDAGYPDYADILRPKPRSIAETVATLDEGDVIVLPLVYGDRAVTIVVTREGLVWAQTFHAHASQIALFNRLRRSLDEGAVLQDTVDPFDTAAAHELYNWFFPPAIRTALRGKARLIFPSGGAFSRIPPAVLLTRPQTGDEPPAFLIRDFAISVDPGLRSEVAKVGAATRAFAGIGDPVLGPASTSGTGLRGLEVDLARLRDLPSLPGTARELESMRAALNDGETLLLTGTRATEDEVRTAPLHEYRVLAFATHGLVSGQIDGLIEPALVLTPPDDAGGGANDGLLLASEIAEMRLNADWVILSACSTAAGDRQGAAAYGGLARAFQIAGARSLLLSHWQVRDDVAAFLSIGTIERVANGMDRAEALRQTQLEMINGAIAGGGRPSLWAPFVLIGE